MIGAASSHRDVSSAGASLGRAAAEVLSPVDVLPPSPRDVLPEALALAERIVALLDADEVAAVSQAASQRHMLPIARGMARGLVDALADLRRS